MAVKLGARWDDPALDDRIRRAHARGLIDYVEINYPVPYGTDVAALGVPILTHTSSNPTCSVHGVDPSVARMVRDAAVAADSPWIGEHLTWLGSAESGSLGYQINPLFTRDFKDVAAANIGRLRAFYGRELAIELGPVYVDATDYDSEMHFLGEVARAVDATSFSTSPTGRSPIATSAGPATTGSTRSTASASSSFTSPACAKARTVSGTIRTATCPTTTC